jgi:uncharacterized membrane protein YdjX (TVP38/TMEM64 family)
MRTEETGSEAVDRVSLWSSFRKPILLITGLMVAGIVLRETNGTLNAGVIDRFVAGRGIVGDLVFVLVGAAACAVGIPRQAIAFAASYAFGLWAGAPLALLAQTIGCIATFGWARVLGRSWAARRVRGRLARADRFLATHPFAATLILRLLPVGSSFALNLLAGVSAVPVLPFLAASVVGYIPQTVIFALLGGGVRIGQGAQIGIAAGLFLVSGLVGLWLLRRQRQLAAIALDEEEPELRG